MGKVKIVYDCELRRPACALLQAALGGDLGAASHFPVSTWLVSPTPGMRAYEVNEAQLSVLKQIKPKK